MFGFPQMNNAGQYPQNPGNFRVPQGPKPPQMAFNQQNPRPVMQQNAHNYHNLLNDFSFAQNQKPSGSATPQYAQNQAYQQAQNTPNSANNGVFYHKSDRSNSIDTKINSGTSAGINSALKGQVFQENPGFAPQNHQQPQNFTTVLGNLPTGTVNNVLSAHQQQQHSHGPHHQQQPSGQFGVQNQANQLNQVQNQQPVKKNSVAPAHKILMAKPKSSAPHIVLGNKSVNNGTNQINNVPGTPVYINHTATPSQQLPLTPQQQQGQQYPGEVLRNKENIVVFQAATTRLEGTKKDLKAPLQPVNHQQQQCVPAQLLISPLETVRNHQNEVKIVQNLEEKTPMTPVLSHQATPVFLPSCLNIFFSADLPSPAPENTFSVSVTPLEERPNAVQAGNSQSFDQQTMQSSKTQEKEDQITIQQEIIEKEEQILQTDINMISFDNGISRKTMTTEQRQTTIADLLMMKTEEPAQEIGCKTEKISSRRQQEKISIDVSSLSIQPEDQALTQGNCHTPIPIGQQTGDQSVVIVQETQEISKIDMEIAVTEEKMMKTEMNTSVCVCNHAITTINDTSTMQIEQLNTVSNNGRSISMSRREKTTDRYSHKHQYSKGENTIEHRDLSSASSVEREETSSNYSKKKQQVLRPKQRKKVSCTGFKEDQVYLNPQLQPAKKKRYSSDDKIRMLSPIPVSPDIALKSSKARGKSTTHVLTNHHNQLHQHQQGHKASKTAVQLKETAKELREREYSLQNSNQRRAGLKNIKESGKSDSDSDDKESANRTQTHSRLKESRVTRKTTTVPGSAKASNDLNIQNVSHVMKSGIHDGNSSMVGGNNGRGNSGNPPSPSVFPSVPFNLGQFYNGMMYNPFISCAGGFWPPAGSFVPVPGNNGMLLISPQPSINQVVTPIMGTMVQGTPALPATAVFSHANSVSSNRMNYNNGDNVSENGGNQGQIAEISSHTIAGQLGNGQNFLDRSFVSPDSSDLKPFSLTKQPSQPELRQLNTRKHSQNTQNTEVNVSGTVQPGHTKNLSSNFTSSMNPNSAKGRPSSLADSMFISRPTEKYSEASVVLSKLKNDSGSPTKMSTTSPMMEIPRKDTYQTVINIPSTPNLSENRSPMQENSNFGNAGARRRGLEKHEESPITPNSPSKWARNRLSGGDIVEAELTSGDVGISRTISTEIPQRKNWKLDIQFDSRDEKTMNESAIVAGQNNESLAEIFRKRRRDLYIKFEHDTGKNSPTKRTKSCATTHRTKEELIQIRKDLVKDRHSKKMSNILHMHNTSIIQNPSNNSMMEPTTPGPNRDHREDSRTHKEVAEAVIHLNNFEVSSAQRENDRSGHFPRPSTASVMSQQPRATTSNCPSTSVKSRFRKNTATTAKKEDKLMATPQASSNYSKPSGVKEPTDDTMYRLAMGIRKKVSKKEMIELTKQHYDQLPEVVKRKEEKRKTEQRREDLKKRKDNVKKLDDRLRKHLGTKKNEET